MINTRNYLSNFRIIGLVLTTVCLVNVAEAAGSFALKVEVRTDDSANVLHITMTNVSEAPLSVPFGYLPWNRNAMVLVLAGGTAPATLLKEQRVIADPLPGDLIQLPKGGTLTGKVKLDVRFPDLPRFLLKDDVIVFWNYELLEGSGDRVGGWVLIPKTIRPSGKEP